MKTEKTPLEWMQSKGWDYIVVPVGVFVVIAVWKGLTMIVVRDSYDAAWATAIFEVCMIEGAQ